MDSLFLLVSIAMGMIIYFVKIPDSGTRNKRNWGEADLHELYYSNNSL